MDNTLKQGYKAELLVRPSSSSIAIRIAINGGCGLAPKCKGMGDYVAEQIRMPLPNSGIVTASWTPRKHTDGTTFTATFAGYEEPSGEFIRFDNARNRDVLHMDSYYRGRTQKHQWKLNLKDSQMINRRRVALIQLMRVLEKNVDWQIPAWFYMPWCIWWEEYANFPPKLHKRKLESIFMTDMCEAIMAYVCLNPDVPEPVRTDTGIAKRTLEAINEAIDRVVFALDRTSTFEFKVIIFGHTTILPFLMYAPPGAKLEGPNEFIEPLLRT